MPSSRRSPTASRAPKRWCAGSIRSATAALKQAWIKLATYCFNWGGLIGTLLTIPVAKTSGPPHHVPPSISPASALALLATFGLDLPSETRLLHVLLHRPDRCSACSAASPSIYPSCFPTRLRSTGSGFCYNIGRVVDGRSAFSRWARSRRGQGRSGHRAARAVHDRLRADRRPAAAALGHRNARPEDARLTAGTSGLIREKSSKSAAALNITGPDVPRGVGLVGSLDQ